MESRHADVAPETPVTESKAESGRFPARIKGQLTAVAVLLALGAIVWPSVVSLIWVGLSGLATWKTFQCHRAASRALSAMLVVDAVMLYAVGSGLALSSLVDGGVVLAFAVYVLFLAGYLIFSPSMRAVFRKSKTWDRTGR